MLVWPCAGERGILCSKVVSQRLHRGAPAAPGREAGPAESFGHRDRNIDQGEHVGNSAPQTALEVCVEMPQLTTLL